MNKDTETAIIRSWALLAGADGKIRREEEALLRTVNSARSFVGDTQAALTEIAEAAKSLPGKTAVYLAEIGRQLGPLSADVKGALVMSWVLLCHADAEIAAAETDMLVKLVEAANVDRSTVVRSMMKYVASRM